MMNAIQVSVKTNTVLVCKNLAEAQFRCMECCKAFISEIHLAKHNHKRHGPYFITGYEQADVANENERRLTDVTGRLEKALTHLEAKTSNLGSSPSNDRPEDTVRENLRTTNAPNNEFPFKTPQRSLEVRRSFSLFTLPNDRVCEPLVDGWMTEYANEGRTNIDTVPTGDIINTSILEGTDDLTKPVTPNEDNQESWVQNVPFVEPTVEPIPEEVTQTANVAPKICSQENPVGPDQQVDNSVNDRQIFSIEPLLIDLIKKLDTVVIGNRLVMNSSSQTEVVEPIGQSHLPEQFEPENNSLAPEQKTVRFSDLPMYYGSSEQHFNQSESDSSSRCESKCEGEGDRFIEREEFQTYTNHSARSHVTRSVHHRPESAEETRIQTNTSHSDRIRSESSEETKVQTYTIRSAQSNEPRLVCHRPRSHEKIQIMCDTESAERTRVLESSRARNEVDCSHLPDSYQTTEVKQDVRKPQHEVETSEFQEPDQRCTDEHESDDDCSRSLETAVPAAAALEAAVAVEVKAAVEAEAAFDNEPRRNPQPSPTTTKTNSANYIATKKQILDIVEKCVNDLKAKRKQSNAASPDNVPDEENNRNSAISREGGNSGSADDKEIPNQESPEKRKNSCDKKRKNVISAGNGNITLNSRGISPPCTVICKDEEPDIDELSGDSYEQFMKRFFSRVSEPQRGIEQSPTDRQHLTANANEEHRERHRSLDHDVSTTANQNPALDCQNGTIAGRMHLPSKDSDLKKTDYAVLLHHETSQVQSLIDTLVSDLQRWRNARRDRLSHAIKLQLEERLASNLNLLGIQSNAKFLPDSAATAAHLLLNNRRSKSAKEPPSPYFHVLKNAFAKELDRIAKSRVKSCPAV